MKKIALSLLAIAMFVACTSGGLDKKLSGNTYNAGMKIEIKDSTDQMEMMMAQMAEQFKFDMVFEESGKMTMSVNTDDIADSTVTAPTTEDFTWAVKGDSLIITDQSSMPQSFLVKETATGFEFLNPDVTFVLTSIQK